jgi:peroxiredoxin
MRFIASAVAALALFGAAWAHDLGPAVGAVAPPVSAADERGTAQTFASLKGDKGLVLVFTRSADWCPYCQKQIIDLDGAKAAFDARGYALAVVATDGPDKLLKFDAKREIDFPLLSDAQFRVIDAYALRDPAYPPGHKFHGLPVPTVFVLDSDRRVVAKLGDLSYKVRPSVEDVLAAIDKGR